MFIPSEAHSLKVGDHFSWSQGGATVGEVVEQSFIDYWGTSLVLYRGSDGLHGHAADHTVVWIMS